MRRLFTVALLATWVVSSALHADFIGVKASRLDGNGDWWYNTFTVNSTTQFALYFAADYQAQALIIDENSVNSFTNGGSVSYYSGFDGNFGINYVTLSPGSYAVAVRNSANGDNTFSLELETFPMDNSGDYVQAGIGATEYVSANGGILTHNFTVESGYSYAIEGLNSGGTDVYVIPASEVSAFRAGNTFEYYTDYSGESDANLPGLWTLDLAPGEYSLAIRNNSGIRKAVVYQMSIFTSSSGGGTPGGIGSSDVGFSGSVGYDISGASATLTAARVENTGSGTSGTLKLSLWATTSRYSGGRITGYEIGSYTFADVLQEGQYYFDIEQTFAASFPPDGNYSMTVLLSEYQEGEFVIVDYLTFDGTTQFGDSSDGGGPVQSWFLSADEIANGWRYFDWFKGFKPEGPNWIYHGRHGWMYVIAENTSGMFLWDVALGRWMYTNETIYPWMYAYGADGGWVFFFEGGSPGARFFVRGDNGATISEDELKAN